MNNVEEGKVPTIEVMNDKIIICISKTGLIRAVLGNPNICCKILDENKFMREFAAQLENPHSSNATELGLSELQMTFDACIEAVIESGSESIELHEYSGE